MAKNKQSRSKSNQQEKQTEVQEKKLKEKLSIDHIVPKGFGIKFKNESQKQYWEQIHANEITLCSGPAGTGKSFISIAKAINLILDKNNEYNKIIIVKPVVEADEHLGFLPGNLEEKLEPYIFSSMYIFEKLIGKDATKKLIEFGHIQVMALAYLRGTNIDNAVLIFEEAQNSTPRQMKTILTRIGENSKFVISGDLEQNDRFDKKEKTGLYDAMEKLKGINKIGLFQFKEEDIVRNPLINKILEKY